MNFVAHEILWEGSFTPKEECGTSKHPQGSGKFGLPIEASLQNINGLIVSRRDQNSSETRGSISNVLVGTKTLQKYLVQS